MPPAEVVVLTGAQGFLGRWTAAALLAGDPAVTVVGVGRSERSAGHYSADVSRGAEQVRAPLPEPLLSLDAHPRYRYRRVDVASRQDVQSLLEDVRPTVVVHSAAALRDESWSRLVAANVAGTAAVVEALGAVVPDARLVLVSSGSVYGTGGRLPLHEAAHCRPVDPYGVTKRSAEDVARVASQRARFGLWTARVFNLVGPGLQERHLAAALAAQLTGIGAGLLPPELRVGTLSTTRDYIDVRDAAAALALLARTAAPAPDESSDASDQAVEVVNLASGVETPVQQVLDLLLTAVDARLPLPRLEVVRLPTRPADLPRVVADTGRLAALGWRPEHGLGGSLQDMVDYYVDQVLLTR